MNANLKQTSFKVPLSFDAHEIAHKRRQGISDTDKAKQIYLNTLAVYAVNYYLECMGFKTNWEDSKQNNPWMLSLGINKNNIKFDKILSITAGGYELFKPSPVIFSHNGDKIAYLDDERVITIWNKTNEETKILKDDLGNIRSIKFSPDSKILASGDDGCLT